MLCRDDFLLILEVLLDLGVILDDVLPLPCLHLTLSIGIYWNFYLHFSRQDNRKLLRLLALDTHCALIQTKPSVPFSVDSTWILELPLLFFFRFFLWRTYIDRLDIGRERDLNNLIDECELRSAIFFKNIACLFLSFVKGKTAVVMLMITLELVNQRETFPSPPPPNFVFLSFSFRFFFYYFFFFVLFFCVIDYLFMRIVCKPWGFYIILKTFSSAAFFRLKYAKNSLSIIL